MRLRRLDLTRYGAFTGDTLDFGALRAGAPDLHIIFGVNEAGKSTLRTAIGDLLFGMDRRTPFGFLHGYKAMEIGAAVEMDGKTLEWRRIKADRNDLLGPDGSAAGAALAEAMLGGIDRKTFELMFSLDGESLKEGGEELQRSHGRLGEALFSATSGLSSITAALDAVRAQAETIFKPRGKKQRLSALKRELDEIDDQRRQTEVSAPDYRKLVEAAEQAGAAYRQALQDRDADRKTLRRYERWQRALDDWASLRLARERLEALSHIPDIPEDVNDRIASLHDEADRHHREAERTRAELERLKAARLNLEPDHAIMSEAERIDRLLSLKARFDEAQDSLPDAEADLAAQRGRLLEAMQRIGAPEERAPEDVLLPAPLTLRLNELIRAHDRLSDALETAAQEAEDARRAVQDLAQTAETLGPPIEPEMLHQLRHDARAARSALETGTLEDAIEEAREKETIAATALAPWHGPADDLRALSPPADADSRRWTDMLAKAREDRDRAERLRAEKAQSAAELRAAHEAIRAEAGLPDESEVKAARAARNEHWQAHRAAIREGALSRIAGTADAFESAMLSDDSLREKRARHSDDAARLRQRAVDAAQAEAAAAAAEQAREAAQARINAAQMEIDASAARLGLPSGMPPETLAEWAEARQRTLSAHDDLARLESRLAAIENSRETLSTRISTVMAAAGMPSGAGLSFSALVEMAEQNIRAAELANARLAETQQHWKTATSGLDQRERREAQAREAFDDWTRQWQQAVRACWLGADGTARTPAEIAEILVALERVREAHVQVRQLEGDIARWAKARDSFLDLCRAVAKPTSVAMDEADPGKTVRALRERLDEARRVQGKRELNEEDMARLREDLSGLERKRETTIAERDQLCARFAMPEEADLRGMLDQARAKALAAREAGDIEERLRVAFEGRALDDIERELAGCDADDLAVEAERLSAEIEARDERVRELYHAMKTAEGAVGAVGADARAAELAERRRLVLLEIDDAAARYLRLKAGISAAEAALRLYRDKHRSGMMLSAAEALRHITAGRFADLQSRPDAQGETLVAIRAGGGSLTVDQMSDGTRDQLYLALRMAGYREFAAERAPLPFIADDVMQSFDDDRARASFEVLAGVARLGQVIYMTHHAHLCDLARDAVGSDVRVHQLPAPDAAHQRGLTSAQAG